MSKKEKTTVNAVCISSCIIAPGEQAERGEIFEDMPVKQFEPLKKLGRFREATAEEMADAADADPDADPDAEGKGKGKGKAKGK